MTKIIVRIETSFSTAALLICFAASLIAQSTTPGGRLPTADPETAGMSSERLALIDAAVEKSIANKETPGAVVLVGRRGRVVFRKAYGNRALKPSVEPMTTDTVFDVASLTKPLATATSVMILIEQGKLRLRDTIGDFIKDIDDENAKKVTIEQLLTHTSGYRPDFDLKEQWSGKAGMLESLKKEMLRSPPGEKFVYSDIGFIVLGEIVERVSGKPLDQFVRETQFDSLTDTRFIRRGTGSVDSNDFLRIAPTENVCGQQRYLGGNASADCDPSMVLRGQVHDPTAFRMEGVAGHAGLFSTADDLALLCDMYLNGGTLNGSRLLSPLSIAAMTNRRRVGDAGYRGLGWDIDTSYSTNRGDLFPVGSFGHTGFTGTSIWMDPASGVFVVFLSNRVHPDGKGNVVDLRARVSTIAAASIIDPPHSGIPEVTVLNGIDVLEKEGFTRLAGLRIGLVTNQSGRSLSGRSTIDILHESPKVDLRALFSPEHGIRGELDQATIEDTIDSKTGLTIYSLYGKTRRPTPEQLLNIDALVFDIQDIGTRFYTYISTLRYVMEEAAKAGKRVIVLDRSNPINGIDVAGPLADEDKLSFVAAHTIPVRHAMTVGELALMMNSERGIGAKLEVAKMEGWRREMWFDETGQYWVNPSPNMRSVTQALLYPGIGLLETTNLSVGRGTDTPFEIIGAPWLDGAELAFALNSKKLPGVRFVPVNFKPSSSVFANENCSGIKIIITDRRQFEPLQTGVEIAIYFLEKYDGKWEFSKYSRLLLNAEMMHLLQDKSTRSTIGGFNKISVSKFLLRRRNFLLY